MLSQFDVYCRRCGNNADDSFQIHRVSNFPYKGKLTFTELSLVSIGVLKIVHCGNCGCDMLFNSNDRFVRRIE